MDSARPRSTVAELLALPALKTPNWFFNSISLAFWLTTSTGSVEDRARTVEGNALDTRTAHASAGDLVGDLGRVAGVADGERRVQPVESGRLQRVGGGDSVRSLTCSPSIGLAVPIPQFVSTHRVRGANSPVIVAHGPRGYEPSTCVRTGEGRQPEFQRSVCAMRIASRANGSSWRPAMRSVMSDCLANRSSTRPDSSGCSHP